MPVSSNPKTKFPREKVIAAVTPIFEALKPHCEMIQLAGSLRRGKRFCSDAEIVFVPKMREERDGLFDTRTVSEAHEYIDHLLTSGVIEKRKNVKGVESWGEKNMLGRDVKSGIPVDLFATKKGFFWNTLVCRTGGERSNIRLALAAKQKGLAWHPYHGGFTNRKTGELIFCHSEEEVFAVAGLDYLPPHLRA